MQPLPLGLLSFEAIKQNKKVLLQWKTENEVNTLRFIVERSSDGNNYLPIGEVPALNTGGINSYSLTDVQPFADFNFYRLKLLDRDGAFKYSPVRKIDFSVNTDDITVYPNPVVQSNLFIASSGNCFNATVYDAAGKAVRSFLLQGRNNTLKLDGI